MMLPKRLLVFNCHEAWVAQLATLAMPLDIIIGLKGRHVSGWDSAMRPPPKNARLIQLNGALAMPGAYRCVIAHNLSDLLEVKSLNIPKLLVLHCTLEGMIADQHPSTPADEIVRATAKYVQLIHPHVIATSKLKAESWGFVRDVVENSVNVSDYPAATAELPRGLRVANDILRKSNTLMWSFHEQAFAGVRITIVGRNSEMPGVQPSSDWTDLKRIFQKHRFFIHTADPRFEDGYNLAVLEAMASGLPVLGNCHPTSPVEHGVSGFLSDDPNALRDYAHILLNDRDLALRMGAAARETVRARFSPEEFRAGMLRAIDNACHILKPLVTGA